MYVLFLGVYYIIRKVLLIIKIGFMRYFFKFKIDFFVYVRYIFFFLGFFLLFLLCYNNSCKIILNFFVYFKECIFDFFNLDFDLEMVKIVVKLRKIL